MDTLTELDMFAQIARRRCKDVEQLLAANLSIKHFDRRPIHDAL